ncbi:MAG: hypothetical protein H0W43_07225 [Chthoniobacterales bacterium]|nr:hypothetical protein [Chthoniobacterales bacterium]
MLIVMKPGATASFFEPKAPAAERDKLHLPEMLFMITSSILVFDHRLRSPKIVPPRPGR